MVTKDFENCLLGENISSYLKKDDLMKGHHAEPKTLAPS